MTALLCVIFFISGASALIFETLWFRQAGLAFGNSVWASSLVLSGFMGGLALGNALAARYGDRLRNPVRAYALAEGAIALTGVGLVYLFPHLGAALAPWFRPLMDQPWLLNPLRLFCAFLLLLIPSTAMGITLPLLIKTLMGYDPHFGAVLGRLYGWNTLGAVSGVLIGELVFIGAAGVHGTALTAGAFNVVAAMAAWWLSMNTPRLSPAPAIRREQVARSGWAVRWWLLAAFLSGFCLLALEVVWFRFLLLFVEGHAMAFALMLAIVLAGIALGGLAASVWLRRKPNAHQFASSFALCAGVLVVASYTVFSRIIQPFASTLIIDAVPILRIGVPLMFPVSICSGIFFTLAGAGLRSHLASEIETAGALTLVNTAGAALGSLAGGFLLLPLLGMERSFFVIALLYAGIGLTLMLTSPAGRRLTYASLCVLLISLFLFPFGEMRQRFIQIPFTRWAGTDAIVSGIREGLTETIIYIQKRIMSKPAYYLMLTNSFSMSSTGWGSKRYMKLFVYLPMAIHPDAKHALMIAYGVGNTAKALTDTKSLDTIDVVELSRDVLEMNRIVYPHPADQPLQDPRIRVHIEDGRYFLQMTQQRFDLITGEPPPPGIAGVENLYSREYFQLIHNRLAEGGIVTYWLPLHMLSDNSAKAILHAFCDVFSDCSLWNGRGTDLIMAGSRSAQGPVSEELFTRQWNDPVVAAEMRRLGLERPEQLGALFIGGADYLKGIYTDSPPLVDDFPRRIEPVVGSQEEQERVWRSFADVDAARERFQRSPLIRQWWPERLITASLPFFEFQDVINANLYVRPLNYFPPIDLVHLLLTQSSLQTPVLWLLGSNGDIERIMADATSEEMAQPGMQYHLGVRLLAERRYVEAVEPLSRAELAPGYRDKAFRLRVYALCMAGRVDQAQQLAQERLAQVVAAKGLKADSLTEADLPTFWAWMKKTFGIDPLVINQPPYDSLRSS
jgi:spermidine synthase